MVTATLGGTQSPEVSRARVLDNARHWECHGFGILIFREKETGPFIGRGGLRRVTVDGIPEVEVLYALRSEFWGKGLGTEMAAGIVAHAFGTLSLESVVAYTTRGNLASRRIMEKTGFVVDREIVHAGLPHLLYRLRR